MDILSIYDALLAWAAEQFSDVVIMGRILWLASGEPAKLRLAIVDGSLIDIYLSITGKYSYHWERRLIDGTITAMIMRLTRVGDIFRLFLSIFTTAHKRL